MIRLDNSKINFKKNFTHQENSIINPYSSDNKFVFTGSGKASLSVVLKFLRHTGVLENKMSEIIVPKWIGIAVYQSILLHCFPTTFFSKNTSVVIAYHQYGFPQNMDKVLDFCNSKKLILIEDCAHVIDSKYNGKSLGHFGDFSIHSFSKFLFCFALGGVRFKNPDLLEYLAEEINRSSSLMRTSINFFKFTDELLLNKKVNLQNFREIIYTFYPKSFKSSKFAEYFFLKSYFYEVESRRKNYQILCNELKNYGVLDHLEKHNVVPYAVPLLIKKNNTEIIEKLRLKNFEVGEYWFDRNRFVIEPDFVKCLLVPIHSNLGNTNLEIMINTIKNNL